MADKSKIAVKSYRRAVSEVTAKSGDLRDSSDEETTVQCECCGISEECTPEYITGVKTIFFGRWVCGLCAEAVKEQARKNPTLPLPAALESHVALCVTFRRTVTVNPKLSFARSMRDIARTNSQRRRSNCLFRKQIGRTASCIDVFDGKIDSSSF